MSPEQLKRFLVASRVVYAVVLLLLVALLVGSALAERYNLVYHWNELRVIDAVTMQRTGTDGSRTEAEAVLPLTVEDLGPGERLTLIASVRTETHDSLMVKTEGAPLRLYVDGALYGSDGDPGTFPGFQGAPPPNLLTVALPSESGGKEIRLEYTVPASLESLELPAFYLGDTQVLFMHLLSQNGPLFGLSLLLMLGGIVLAAVTLLILPRLPAAGPLPWLGLACLVAGLWGFCGNDLTVYLIPVPNLLYVGSVMGLLYFALPFLRYGMAMLDPRPRMPLAVLHNVMRIVFLFALLLHLVGLYPFRDSLVYLRFLPFVAVILFGLSVVYELVAHRNPQARRLWVPTGILTVCAVASIVDRFFPFMGPESMFFEIGILVFAVWTTYLGWGYLRETIDEAERSAQLAHEVETMNNSLDMQRNLYQKLNQSTEQVRALRHDLRHQLGAIRGYLQKDDVDGALGYVDSISGGIPEIADKLLCDNFAVNAVAVHYLDMAARNHIQADLRLVVPEDLGQVPDNDMSIIVGNLLENAIEACLYVDEDRRFIRMTSKVAKRRLAIVIDNSFDGTYTERGGEFYSRKRQGKGIGISSVRAVVERYGGALKYEVANGVFMTSLYVKM
ncbi:MAG: GHKL domain-containing protein [Coriobacteriales bacterium]|jgi:hypothetical protein|nr:GHKL domain-containing protein [Coriobacteriales bacterium]